MEYLRKLDDCLSSGYKMCQESCPKCKVSSPAQLSTVAGPEFFVLPEM